MFIYSDHSEPFQGNVDFTRMNSTRQYLKHFDNLLTLEFISKNTTDRNERVQCEKEMAIARRKLRFWERMPNFCKDEMLRGIMELKQKWTKS